MKTKLTPAAIGKLTAPGCYWDASMAGFGLLITPGGHRSFICQYRNAAGVSRRQTIKLVLGLEAARLEARKLQGDVARGLDPVAQKRKERQAVKTTLAAVFDLYEKLEGGKLCSAAARRGVFARYVLPALGSRPIKEIRRGEIVSLLDSIQAATGVRTANIALMLLSRVFGWYSIRNEEFRSPLVKGMARRENPARDRVLSDDEIRALWAATADLSDPFNRLVRFTLLTATRRTEGAAMSRSELDGDAWSIPASRYKVGAEMLIPLSGAARAVLASAPKIGPGDWVFTIDGRARIGGFSRRKTALDARMRAAGLDSLPAWRIHDLRRTARSLMSRAGVAADIAERALGHTLPTIRRTYDRHSYVAEKRAAFEALARQVEMILHPTDNVISIRRG
jgi:integrase